MSHKHTPRHNKANKHHSLARSKIYNTESDSHTSSKPPARAWVDGQYLPLLTIVIGVTH